MASSVTITTSSGADGVGPAVNVSWATVRNATTGTLNATYLINRLNAGNYSITRHFFFFDLSPTNIPAGSIITGITFVHPVVGNVTNDESMTIHLTAHTAADPIVEASYNDITLDGDTSWSEKAISDLSTSETTNITVNSTGIAAAQSALGGTWKVCIRGDKDLDDTTPTGVNQYSYTQDNAQIIVTYNPPGGFAALYL